MNINKMLEDGLIPNDLDIYKSFMVTHNKFEEYHKIVCSISGGADSDVMLDLFCRFDKDKVTFVFFDTGLEYQATKDHLKYLEEKYGIEIVRIKAEKPIPLVCRDNGEPFLSKQVSENIKRLQKYNFQWEDEPFEILRERYCTLNDKGEWRGCLSALMWWCNERGDKSRFNINYNKWLREFMIANPPTFKISPDCCKYAKKNVSKHFIAENDFDLNCYGVRKAEGGVRATAYKNCFTNRKDDDYKIDEYRPIFWYKDETKEVYEKFFDVTHSKCYSEYGLKRTGCSGCPFGRDFEFELSVLEKFEPKLHKAVINIFKNSYEYTRKYKEFCKMMDDEVKKKKEAN